MEKIYKDNEFMEYPKEKKVYNLSTEAIPIDWLRMWFTKNGYLSGMALVDKIESDWEKENE